MTFKLHPDFDAWPAVGDLSICRVLLHVRYSQFPWLVLVPRREGCRDLTDLPAGEYVPVMGEVCLVHDTVRSLVKADKMNVAALGNVTPQLHIHVIARFKTDPAWPKPVWTNEGAPIPYPDGGEKFLGQLRQELRGLQPPSEY